MAFRLSRKRISASLKNKSFALSAGYLLLFMLCAIFVDSLPLSYQPERLDLQHIYQPPFQFSSRISGMSFHWLGTDQLGRDVLANLLYGCRTALLVSVPAMLIAAAIGILLGGAAGFYGDNSLHIPFASAVILPVFLLLAFFYGFYVRQIPMAGAFSQSTGEGMLSLGMSMLIFMVIFSAGIWLQILLAKVFPSQCSMYLPLDQMVLKLIELLSSIPRIILILSLAAYAKPSVINLILITGLTYWTEPARLIRAEFLRIRELNYIESARALGLRHFSILIRHALPNALSSMIVAFTFGVVSLISLESTLSFLGIGLSPDVASWGRIVTGIKSDLSAWWLVVFPGILLCVTVLALQTCSNFIVKQMDPRKR